MPKDGSTPLHLASEKGYTETAEMLIKHGANIDTQARVSIAISFVISKRCTFFATSYI